MEEGEEGEEGEKKEEKGSTGVAVTRKEEERGVREGDGVIWNFCSFLNIISNLSH